MISIHADEKQGGINDFLIVCFGGKKVNSELVN